MGIFLKDLLIALFKFWPSSTDHSVTYGVDKVPTLTYAFVVTLTGLKKAGEELRVFFYILNRTFFSFCEMYRDCYGTNGAKAVDGVL